jgi:heterodisulfide reductase subunit A
VRVELIDEGFQVVERKHDLVVLSIGLLPGWNPAGMLDVPVGENGFVDIPAPFISPTVTRQPGIFATGTAAGPMDIVDSIVTASAAAAEVAAYLETQDGHPSGDGLAAPAEKERAVVHA